MGTLSYVSCRDCKITRDLDKFYGFVISEDKNEVIKLSECFKKQDNYYRLALLTSFLAKHSGHNCTVFSEHNVELCEELDPDYNDNIKRDDGYW